MRKLAIIAGQGDLPKQVFLKSSPDQAVVVAFKGQTDPHWPPLEKTLWTRTGKVEEILVFLKKHGVKDLVLVGGVRRPSFKDLSLDSMGILWLKKLGKSFFGGDDTLLSALGKLLEEEGFCLKSSSDFISCYWPVDQKTDFQPDQRVLQDIERGNEVLEILSRVDVGQAIVVQEGLILGVEAIEGTKALLERCISLKRTGLGGVLIKRAKLHQHSQLDLPTIGPETIIQVHQAHLRGISVDQQTQIIDFPKVLTLANQYQLFCHIQ